jgi:hypothetical protein
MKLFGSLKALAFKDKALETDISMASRTILSGETLEANAVILEDYMPKNVTTPATSGTINLAGQTITTLTSVLTNAHTLVITPAKPSVFTGRKWSEVFLTVGATSPSLSWTPPTGVTYEYTEGVPTAALTPNKRHSWFFNWESDTKCIVSRKEW